MIYTSTLEIYKFKYNEDNNNKKKQKQTILKINKTKADSLKYE